MAQQQQQQIISAAQLVPKFQGIRRCNNYDVLQNIPCSTECKIVGQILLDHPLSYAITVTTDVPAVYLQQFWKTIFHVVINRVHVDYAALLWWDFLKCALQKKNVIQYPRFTKLIIVDLMKNFDSIPPRLEEDYHSIKDDIPLVSVYTIGNVTVQGMLISDEFITDDVYATKEYKEYMKVFVG
ncbi:hypothetical protein Tco_1464517, partial [Tanacetum coccineum]